MAKVAELEIIQTPKGPFAVNRHAGDDPRFCIGWQREEKDGQVRWRQRHIQGYGSRCKVCGRVWPLSSREIEEIYQEREKAGADCMEFVDLKGNAGGALL